MKKKNGQIQRSRDKMGSDSSNFVAIIISLVFDICVYGRLNVYIYFTKKLHHLQLDFEKMEFAESFFILLFLLNIIFPYEKKEKHIIQTFHERLKHPKREKKWRPNENNMIHRNFTYNDL